MLSEPLYKVGDVLEMTYSTDPSTVKRIRDLILGSKVKCDGAEEEEPYRVYWVLTTDEESKEFFKTTINTYMTWIRTEEDLMNKFKRIGHIDISGFTDF